MSRHRIKRSFRQPLREWSEAEKIHLESAARSIGLPLRFCRENCGEHPEWALLVVFGDVNQESPDQAVISIQAAASDENSSWETSYEMVVVRSPEGLWSVTEARPGTHADAIPCEVLYGHSCAEQKRIEQEQGKAAGEDQPGERILPGSSPVTAPSRIASRPPTIT